MGYTVSPRVPSELKKNIQEKVEQAKRDKQIKNLKHKGESYEFYRVMLDRDWLYYNLDNDRTLTKTREFIELNDLNSDYFSKENFFNHNAQKDYHSIIEKFIPNEMVKILKETNDQRDPLYVTENGVIANGNTRLSCFRNIDIFKQVECLVFKDDYANDWGFIRQFVDLQDNAIDFSSDYLWYARAERLEKNINELGKSDYKAIAKDMQYKDAKDAEVNHMALKQARAFIDCGLYPKYQKLSDLDKLSTSGSGFQAFNTLAKAVMKYDQDIDFQVTEKLKNLSFSTLGTENNAGFPSAHKAIEHIWSKANILREQKKIDSPTPNILGGQKSNNSSDYNSKLYGGMSFDEIADSHVENMKEVILVKETSTNESMRNSYQNGIRSVLSKWRDLNNLSLNSDSNLDSIEDILDDLDNMLANTKKSVKSLKDFN
jgi:hypothetical protein